MLPCPALLWPALIYDPQLGSAPLIEWADRLAFLIEFQEHLISGQALRAVGGLEATTTTAFDLRELAQWSVRSDAMCLRNYHYGRSANMTGQHRKEEWKSEGREREGMELLAFAFAWKCFCTLLAFTQRGQEMSKWQTVDLVSRKCQSCARFRVAAFGTRLNFELWAMDTRLKLPACLAMNLWNVRKSLTLLAPLACAA